MTPGLALLQMEGSCQSVPAPELDSALPPIMSRGWQREGTEREMASRSEFIFHQFVECVQPQQYRAQPAHFIAGIPGGYSGIKLTNTSGLTSSAPTTCNKDDYRFILDENLKIRLAAHRSGREKE